MGPGTDTQVKVKSKCCQQRAHLPKLLQSRSLTSEGLRPLTQASNSHVGKNSWSASQAPAFLTGTSGDLVHVGSRLDNT